MPLRAAKNDIADAMFAAARKNCHDPVRFYLEDLKVGRCEPFRQRSGQLCRGR